MKEKYDIAIVGGGIIGLAHATLVAEEGKKVLLLERNEKAYGASIRNFGLIWPIGQPSGKLFDRAMTSKTRWLEVAEKAGFWCRKNGSLHIAYHEDELAVMEDYVSNFNPNAQLISPSKITEYSKYVKQEGLLGALWSDLEMSVNPKKAIYAITNWLRSFDNISLNYSEEVQKVEDGYLKTSKGEYEADRILICSGHEFQTLYPEVFANSGLIQSKLQMMRTYPFRDQDFGPTLCGGLTLTHYDAFEGCKGLETLKQRFDEQLPEHRKWGIHVMINQNDEGELVIGDSHEYGVGFDPFNRDEINQLILKYLMNFLDIPEIKIKEYWHGVYSKLPGKTEFIYDPTDGIRIITGLSGAGMTLSFGLAEEQREWLLQ